jgi:hypothetical protein
MIDEELLMTDADLDFLLHLSLKDLKTLIAIIWPPQLRMPVVEGFYHHD